MYPPAFVSQFHLPEHIAQRMMSFKEQWVYLAINCTVVRDEANGDILLYVNFQDIDAKVRKEEQERSGLEKDALTGLPSRQGSERLIDRELSRASRGSLFLVDMDNFDNINNQLGHAKGNGIILETAEALASEFRETDIVGYFGNALFAIFTRLDDKTAIRERAMRINTRLCKMIQHPGAAPVMVSASIGIARYPAHGMDFATLHSHALLALDEAKTRGKNCFQFFDSQQIKSEAEKFEESTLVRNMLSMLGEETLTRAVDEVLLHLGKTCRSDRAFVFEFGTNDDGKQVVHNTAEWCAEGILSVKDNLQGLSVEGWNFFMDPLSNGKMYICENVDDLRETLPEAHAMLSMQGIQRLYVSPIFIHGKLGGFVGVDNPQAGPRSFDLLCNMASFIGREIIRRQNV